MGQVYIVRNVVNGMGYVGATERSMEIRQQEHVRDSRNKSETLFWTALQNYEFEWTVLLDEVPDEDLEKWERYFIKKLSTFRPAGYNCNRGGFGGVNEGIPHSAETKAKIAAAASNRDEEWSKNQSEVQKKVHANKTAEERAAVQSHRKDKTYEEQYGEEKANEIKAKIGLKGRKPKPASYREKLLILWQDPEYRAKQTASRKRAWIKRKERASLD